MADQSVRRGPRGSDQPPPGRRDGERRHSRDGGDWRDPQEPGPRRHQPGDAAGPPQPGRGVPRRRPPRGSQQRPGGGNGRPPKGGRAPARRRRWRHLSTPAKIACIAGSVITAVVVALSLGAYILYWHLGSNLKVVKVNGLTQRSVYGAQNILVLGSQTRQGQKGYFGMSSGAHKYTSNSDNLLLVHLDPTHTHALILSIPRDTMVYEPGCKARIPQIGYGVQGPYQSTIIDGALNIGGPSCAVATVTDLTGVKFDHFVEFNFNSFRTMVDALGGVEVCAPKGGYHDPYSHLNLAAGQHLLTYNQALAYVRTRHGVSAQGDVGGDLPRIELQQAFISSVIQKVNKQGLLSNALQLYKIADTATKALTVDQGLSTSSELLGLARSLIHLRASHVSLLTMPTVTDPASPAQLLPKEPQDDVLFQMIRTGQPWRGRLPTLPPGKVQVRVLNGTATPHLAADTAAALRKLGYDVIGTGNAAYTSATTVDYSGTAQADSAYTLMTSLKSAPAAQNQLAEPAPQAGRAGPVTLVLGADFTGVSPPAPKSGTGSSTRHHRRSSHSQSGGGYTSASYVQSRNAGASICSGLPLANPNPGTPP